MTTIQESSLAEEPAIQCDVKRDKAEETLNSFLEELIEGSGADATTTNAPDEQAPRPDGNYVQVRDEGETDVNNGMHEDEETREAQVGRQASDHPLSMHEIANELTPKATHTQNINAETHFNAAAMELDTQDSTTESAQQETATDGTKGDKSLWTQSGSGRTAQHAKDAEAATPCCGATITFWPFVVLVFVLCPLLGLPVLYFWLKSHRALKRGEMTDARWYGLVTRLAAIFSLAVELVIWTLILSVAIGGAVKQSGEPSDEIGNGINTTEYWNTNAERN